MDNIPKEVMVNVKEDYRICVRMLERGSTPVVEKQKRGLR